MYILHCLLLAELLLLGPSRTARDSRWLEVGRTEEIKDSLSPVFTTGIALDYHFEAVQQLRFVCVDIDTPGLPAEKQELIGVCETTLGEIVGAKGAQVVKRLRCA